MFLLLIFYILIHVTAKLVIYTLSLHDALPICIWGAAEPGTRYIDRPPAGITMASRVVDPPDGRSEEHTSELQSPCNLVCRLLLEKKKKFIDKNFIYINTIPVIKTHI